MKKIFVSDILNMEEGDQVCLMCWVRNRREHRHVTFYDLVDSSGVIQAVVDKTVVGSAFQEMIKYSLESSVEVAGKIAISPQGSREILVESIQLIGDGGHISPHLRNDDQIFDQNLTDHVLSNRHLYIRNEKMMAILKGRHLLLGAVHNWFRDNGFIEITAPVLTALPLYDDGTAISVEINGESVFLTQCVAYYLESAVHAFEKVYNMGPSFRGEESRSKRHLMEYWHIKAEVAFSDREDMIEIVESMLVYLTQFFRDNFSKELEVLGTELCEDGLYTPFPRISYREALEILKESGNEIEFGRSIGSADEAILSSHFQSPVWVTGNPRSIEPFPYVIDPSDPESTMTADLIASRGYGELLGVAEKISDLNQLEERMKEKGKFGQPEYEWLKDLRLFGSVPHAGIGMGLERLLRWLIQIDHVRDAMPFPRTFRRRIHP